MINLKHHYHILYTRMAHSRSVLVGGCEVNIRNINQYSYLPNMGNYVKNNTDPTIYVYTNYLYPNEMYHFSSKIKEQKTTSKAESYRVKSCCQWFGSSLRTPSDRGKSSETPRKGFVQRPCSAAPGSPYVPGKRGCNQNCHTCICVDDRYVYIISICLIICAKNMRILYTVCICIFTYIVSYIVYINSWFIMILCSVRMVEQRHITKMKSPQHVASMRLYRFEAVGQLCYKSCKFLHMKVKKKSCDQKNLKKTCTRWKDWNSVSTLRYSPTIYCRITSTESPSATIFINRWSLKLPNSEFKTISGSHHYKKVISFWVNLIISWRSNLENLWTCWK